MGNHWYKPRRYVHFDWPMSRSKAQALVTNPNRVSRRPFLPFLSYSMAEKRYKPERKRVVQKIRPISFSSHADSHIFSYYAWLLKPQLEEAYHNRRLSDSVLAYRTFPGGKCNIHFAHEVFERIEAAGACVAVAIDVEKFFDSLDHDLLKFRWSELLDTPRLSNDQYAVFRAVTRHASVDVESLYKEFGVGLRARAKLRRPLCTPEEFRTRVRGKGLIQRNDSGRGIPQGSPISAILSNLYMLDIDDRIQRRAEDLQGIYRRYSDDILLISDHQSIQEFERFVVEALDSVLLTVNSTKTQVSEFTQSSVLQCDRPLQYLGFEFDGQRRRLRSKTVGRYSRRMRSGVRSAARAASKAARKGGQGRIRRRELFERYSHLGKRNFIQYAYRAAKIMNDDTPRRQVRRHWRRLSEIINAHDCVDASANP